MALSKKQKPRIATILCSRMEINPSFVELDATEAKGLERVLHDILSCVLAVNEHRGHSPFSLNEDDFDDNFWDWRTYNLTSNQYERFCSIWRYSELGEILTIVSYDWTPTTSGGTMILRMECQFQSEFAQALTDILAGTISKNKLISKAKRDIFEIDAQTRVSVVVGETRGMRTPCRSIGRQQLHLPCFVLEVVMRDSVKYSMLSEIVRSYIEGGALCVMVAVLGYENNEDDYLTRYSLYRRGAKIKTSNEVTRYQMGEIVADITPQNTTEGVLTLTLSDFFTVEEVEKHFGNEMKEDEKKENDKIKISFQSLRACLEHTIENRCESGLPQETKLVNRWMRMSMK